MSQSRFFMRRATVFNFIRLPSSYKTKEASINDLTHGLSVPNQNLLSPASEGLFSSTKTPPKGGACVEKRESE